MTNTIDTLSYYVKEQKKLYTITQDEHGQLIVKTETVDPSHVPPSALIAPPLSKRASMMLPDIPNIMINGCTEIPSPIPVQAILAAFSNAQEDASNWEEADKIPTFQFSKEQGTSYIQVRPDGSAIIVDERLSLWLWEQVRKISDLDGDVLLATLAQAFAGTPDEQGYYIIAAQTILGYRGIEKKKTLTPTGRERTAGHRQEDIAEIAVCMSRLSNIWITINQRIFDNGETGKRKKQTRFSHESRLMNISEYLRQDELTFDANELPKTLYSTPIAWKYQPGTWLRPFLEGANRQFALLLQDTLNYDPYHETWEKRLARYKRL